MKMKKNLLKGILMVVMMMLFSMPVYASTTDGTGSPVAGSKDAYKSVYENALQNGQITNEQFYQAIKEGGFSQSVVAQILDEGYLTEYADKLKEAGMLANTYQVKNTNTQAAANTQAAVNTQTAANTQTTTGATLQQYAAVFDATYYLKMYPQLAQTVGTDPTALLNYFINVGMSQCQQGNAEFNVLVYAQKNPDLYAAFGSNAKQYYIHYITSGKAEGRVAK